MTEDKENKKDIEIVSGDGSNLDISPVYEHLNAAKPQNNNNKPKHIIIPGEKPQENNDDDKNKEDSND